MARGQTKERLLDIGRDVFLELGYHHAGIEAILQAAGVPKGSFYNYFQSKEDFGLQVIDHFAACHDAELDRSLGNAGVSPAERIRSYFEVVIAHLEAGECRRGCLIGNLSQEMAAQSETFRARLEEVFSRWVDRFADCLRQAHAAGQLTSDEDAATVAEFWLNSWQGAILRAKIMRSTAPLRTFLRMTLDRLLVV